VDERRASAVDMARALRAGSVSSRELVDRVLADAEAWQPTINAFSQLWPEEARAEAADVRAGDPRPFAGVPIAVKDLFDVAGHETTGCSRAYEGNVARGDAPMVRRIREAGLVIVGKTNQHELAAGGTNLVSACGRTGNPWDPARITGGSSGGSGAAVAAGIVPWALGSDTGGSIRIPASLCGTFGLKPTTGRLSTDGMLPLAPSLDCPGPMASTLEDLWALDRVLEGGSAAEPSPTGPPEGALVGVPDGLYRDDVADEVVAAVRGVADALRSEGVRCQGLDGRARGPTRPIWQAVVNSEFGRAHLLSPERRALIAPTVQAWMVPPTPPGPGEETPGAGRRRVRAWLLGLLEGRAALLVPTTPYPAYPAEAEEVALGPDRSVSIHRIGLGWMTSSINLAGLPALSLPAGRTAEGMPVGASLVGRPGGEEVLFGLAGGWVRAVAYRPRWPALGSAGDARMVD
jgi:Asp-tRNA(Asn)/Glu-tRNA(Gln) amidotransferase A subunit family amidase